MKYLWNESETGIAEITDIDQGSSIHPTTCFFNTDFVMHPFYPWIFVPLHVFSGAHNSGLRDSPDQANISGLFGWSAIVMVIAMRSISVASGCSITTF
jgi:hypothetical protein